MLKCFLENTCAERRKQRVSRGQNKRQAVMAEGGNTLGKTNSLSYKNLKSKCSLLLVDAEEVGVFTIVMRCWDGFHGDDVHGRSSELISLSQPHAHIKKS